MKECHSIPLNDKDVVADIGAYVGTYSKWCAIQGVCQVRAFEPTPFTCKVLRRNLADFDFCEAVEAAVVGDSFRGISVALHVSDGLGVTNGLVGRKRGQVDVEVPVVKFMDATVGATILKVDVEGAEYSYDFSALPKTVRALMIDFHPVSSDWKEKAQAIVDSLHIQGFEDVVSPDWSNGWTRAGSWLRRIDQI